MEFGLRDHYFPNQPAGINEKVLYKEFRPSKELEGHVYCYWQLKSRERLKSSFAYRVVADGCMDIFFESSEPARSYLVGFQKKSMAFDLGTSFHYVGIRFFPSSFPHLYEVSAKELTDRYVPLSDITENLAAEIEESISPSMPVELLSTAFDEMLAKQTRFSTLPDPRFFKALLSLISMQGKTDASIDLDFGLSPRQLRRYFLYHIGVGPKQFAQVLRFQSILRSRPSSACLRANGGLFDAGYYNQAHFIKEFKRFYGVTPSEVFGR